MQRYKMQCRVNTAKFLCLCVRRKEQQTDVEGEKESRGVEMSCAPDHERLGERSKIKLLKWALFLCQGQCLSVSMGLFPIMCDCVCVWLNIKETPLPPESTIQALLKDYEIHNSTVLYCAGVVVYNQANIEVLPAEKTTICCVRDTGGALVCPHLAASTAYTARFCSRNFTRKTMLVNLL